MKTFRDYLSEEVTPSALVADGSIDIEKDAVRDNINGLLSGSMSCSSVTPYNALMKVRKVLAYFGIQLPKRIYMEGKHGIEVWEVHQFGDRMGMNDQGEFIKSVPAKYYLFFHYHMFGSMFSIRAKIVDREELDKELDMAEAMINEDKDPCWKGYEMVGMKKKGGRKVPNCVPVEEEEQIDELHGKGSLSSIKDYHKAAEKVSTDSSDAQSYHKTSTKRAEQLSNVVKAKKDIAKSKKYSTTEKGWRKLIDAKDKSKQFGDMSKNERKRMNKTGDLKIHNTYLKAKGLREEQIDEKAPPGAKFERMVKHIKKGYSKDGLTAKEKSIAYATAWKAKKRESKD